MRAVYRETPTSPPMACEILEVRVDGIVCREVDKFWPGVFLAKRGTLRRPSGLKACLPAEVKDPVTGRLLAKLKQAGI